MKRSEGPVAIDFDIDRIRGQILNEQQEAMKPFQKRLADLDIVQQVLDREMRVQVDGSARPKALPRKTPALLPERAGPYGHITLVNAVLAILISEPGLMLMEILPKLEAGGRRTTRGSLGQTLRTLVKAQRLRVELPESRIGGQSNRYFVMEKAEAKPFVMKKPETKDIRDLFIPQAIQRVIEEGPPEGLTRTEIVEALHVAGFRFSKSKHGPKMKVAWAVHDMVKNGLIHGRDGKNKAHTKFTIR